MKEKFLKFIFLIPFIMMSCALTPRYNVSPSSQPFYSNKLPNNQFSLSYKDTVNSLHDILLNRKWAFEEISNNEELTPNPIPPFIISISKWLGTKYRFGGSSRKGLDCSGFVNAVFSENGVKLPRSSREIAKKGLDVHPDSVKFGDVICFKNRKGRIFHVGIMLNQDRFAHASKKGVTVGSTNDPYWKNKLATIRRFDVKGLSDTTLNESIDFEAIDESLESE